VLRDAARFARGDVGAADLVEQAGLAVVDVPEDRDDRRTRHARSPSIGPRNSARAVPRAFICARLKLDAEVQRDRARGVAVERWLIVAKTPCCISCLMMSLTFTQGGRERLDSDRLLDLDRLARWATVLAIAWVPRAPAFFRWLSKTARVALAALSASRRAMRSASVNSRSFSIASPRRRRAAAAAGCWSSLGGSGLLLCLLLVLFGDLDAAPGHRARGV
jgi:hypothetical protein